MVSISGTNSFYYFVKFLEKKLKGHFNFENIKTQNVECFFFNFLVLLLLRDTFMQFLYVLQYSFFFSRRINHFRSPLPWCISFFWFVFCCCSRCFLVVVFKFILALLSTFK